MFLPFYNGPLNSSPLGENKTPKEGVVVGYEIIIRNSIWVKRKLPLGVCMQRSKIVFEKIVSYENCYWAIVNASANKSKRKHKEIKEREKTKRVKPYSVINILENIDVFASALQDFLYGLLDGNTSFSQGTIITIHGDGSVKKDRKLCKPRFFPDQCAHWAIMQVVEPELTKGFYDYSCASIRGRGTHYAKNAVERFVKDVSGTKYCLQLDIRHFYENIDKDVLVHLLKKKIKDKRIIEVLSFIIYSYKESGLPLGFYPSAIFANFYLNGLDRYIKETLKAKSYVRYMDDMVIFGQNKRQLHQFRQLIQGYLKTFLHLDLKGNYQVFKMPYAKKNGEVISQRALDFVGFKFYRYKTTIRKAIFKNMRRLYFRIASKKYTFERAAAYNSYNGYLKCTCSKIVKQKYIYGKINIKKIKEVISDENRRINTLARQTIKIKSLYAL